MRCLEFRASPRGVTARPRVRGRILDWRTTAPKALAAIPKFPAAIRGAAKARRGRTARADWDEHESVSSLAPQRKKTQLPIQCARVGEPTRQITDARSV